MNGEAESGHKRPATELPDASPAKRPAIDPATTNGVLVNGTGAGGGHVNGGVVRTVLPGGGMIQQIRQVQPGQVIVSTGGQIMTSSGQIMTSSGQMLNSGGQMINNGGQIVSTASGPQNVIVSSGQQPVLNGGQSQANTMLGQIQQPQVTFDFSTLRMHYPN